MPEEQDNLIREQSFMNSNLQRSQIEANQREGLAEEKNRTMIEDQISLKEELMMIENLLRCKTFSTDDDGNEVWADPKNDEQVLLSEFGINLVLNRVRFYLNKNTLLSNYSEDVINQKMEDFATALADEIYMKYEQVFLFPTPEKVQEALQEMIDNQVQTIVYNRELAGKEIDKDEIKDGVIKEMDLNKQRVKVREALVKAKLKSYEGLLRGVQDIVHSAYLRALNGGERLSLRRTMNISEVIGGGQAMRPKSSGFMGSLRRRR